MESISQEKISQAMKAYLYLTFMSSESFCGWTRYLCVHQDDSPCTPSASPSPFRPGIARVISSEPMFATFIPDHGFDVRSRSQTAFVIDRRIASVVRSCVYTRPWISTMLVRFLSRPSSSFAFHVLRSCRTYKATSLPLSALHSCTTSSSSSSSSNVKLSLSKISCRHVQATRPSCPHRRPSRSHPSHAVDFAGSQGQPR